MTNKPNNTKVVLKNVRLSYVKLLAPEAAFEGQPEKYSTMILIPKSDKKALEDIKAAQKAALDAGLASKFGGKKPANLKTTVRDADADLDTEENPEFADHYFMNVSSFQKPGILNKQKEKTDNPEEVYSGVYAHVSLNFYAYNTAGNKGISAGLNNIMVLGTGDYLGGRASAESDFADFEVEEEDFEVDDLI